MNDPVAIRGMSYRRLHNQNRKQLLLGLSCELCMAVASDSQLPFNDVWGYQPKPLNGPDGSVSLIVEHCHKHDYVRGVACQLCNLSLITIDNYHAKEPPKQRVKQHTEWLVRQEWYKRCPQCAVEPWIYREYGSPECDCKTCQYRRYRDVI